MMNMQRFLQLLLATAWTTLVLAQTPPAQTPPAQTPPAQTTPPAAAVPAQGPPAQTPATPAQAAPAQTAPARTATDREFVMDDVSLTEMIDILAKRMKINYILDKRVNGSVTIHTYGEVKPVDYMPLLMTIPLIITSFWLGRRYELFTLRKRLERRE